MGKKLVDSFEYEGDIQVAKAHGLIDDNGMIEVEDSD